MSSKSSAGALDRRSFLAGSLAGAALPFSAARAADPAFANGVKIGEVTPTSALVWTRLTAGPRNETGEEFKGTIQGNNVRPEPPNPDVLRGACLGAKGRVRIRYGDSAELNGVTPGDWKAVGPERDSTAQFRLEGLRPSTRTHFRVESEAGGSISGQFRTAPEPNASENIRLCVLTCQMYADLDDPAGFHIYPAISQLDPRCVVFTGDNVYYDNEEPRAVTARIARYHWERMYSLPRHIEMLRGVATCWEKDDHDVLRDDCGPSTGPMGRFTFAEGQEIYRQQVPLEGSSYRTFRWGRHLQIWLTDGRDFRSPNRMADGPEKSIWGREQKEWLMRTLQESPATWKLLISPTPLVGPDRPNKNDNHSNIGFAHEGREFRAWAAKTLGKRFFNLCGDRHWQYHSVDPDTGLNEFSVGPASDEHAAGTPGEDRRYHRFHRVKGGFLSVDAESNAIHFRHRDVHGREVYAWSERL